MAIDPTISLAVRPVQMPLPNIQSPVDRLAQVLSLRNLMTQGQSGQLGLQREQLQLQEAQRQADAESTLRANPNLTDTELIGTLGSRAIPLLKARSELYEQQLKTNAQKAARLGQLAGSAVDTPSYQNAIMSAASEKLIDPDHARQLSGLNWDDPATQAQVKQFQQQALTAEQQHNTAIADEKAKREQLLFGPQLAEAQSKQRQAALQDAGQTVQSLTSMNDFPAWLAKQAPEAQQYYGGLSNLPLDQVKQIVGMAATQPKPGETLPLPAAVQQQHVETAAAQGLAAAQAQLTAKDLNNSQLAAAIVKPGGDKLYATLTPEKQNELQPLLARMGFTQFTKPPSDTELTTLYNTQRNLDAVKSLQKDFASGKYDWMTGPIVGHVKDIPWLGDNAKGLEARMDELRSTVGDLVKGGTLRSSDIPVYEKMFPKSTDTTPVIKEKLNNLADRLGTDLSTYRASLQSAGRALPDQAGPATGPPPGEGVAPAGSTPALKQSKPGDEPKMVWFGPDGKEYNKAPAVAAKAATQGTNPNPTGYIPGHVYGGKTYLGGDPYKRESWQ